MRFLIAVDLEGVNYVTGKPYKGLEKELPEYEVAVREAERELNAVVAGLYKANASEIFVWDNHGAGHNLNFTRVDARVRQVELDKAGERMAFADALRLDGIVLLGYHAKEGTPDAVLAHSYNSSSIQYYKWNGVQIGEIGCDIFIAGSLDIPPVLVVSDDKGCTEAKAVSDDIVTVVTKIGMGRNKARFKTDALYAELREAAERAAQLPHKTIKPLFPAKLEIRYTRIEQAESIKSSMRKRGILAEYGEDAHVLCVRLTDIRQMKLFL